MSASSVARLKISWLMVCRRVSTSPVTVERTNVSGTCCRSTSTVAVERYTLGIDVTSPNTTQAGAAKTISAIHLRRRQRPVIRSSTARFRRVEGRHGTSTMSPGSRRRLPCSPPAAVTLL